MSRQICGIESTSSGANLVWLNDNLIVPVPAPINLDFLAKHRARLHILPLGLGAPTSLVRLLIRMLRARLDH
jgi:hypothetical protein